MKFLNRLKLNTNSVDGLVICYFVMSLLMIASIPLSGALYDPDAANPFGMKDEMVTKMLTICCYPIVLSLVSFLLTYIKIKSGDRTNAIRSGHSGRNTAHRARKREYGLVFAVCIFFLGYIVYASTGEADLHTTDPVLAWILSIFGAVSGYVYHKMCMYLS